MALTEAVLAILAAGSCREARQEKAITGEILNASSIADARITIDCYGTSVSQKGLRKDEGSVSLGELATWYSHWWGRIASLIYLEAAVWEADRLLLRIAVGCNIVGRTAEGGRGLSVQQNQTTTATKSTRHLILPFFFASNLARER